MSKRGQISFTTINAINYPLAATREGAAKVMNIYLYMKS